MNIKFFKAKKTSNKINAGGPSHHDQLSALAHNEYWTVLNTSLLKFPSKDELLIDRANAFKHSLQTYGPSSNKLPDLRLNKGNVQGSIFHGHVKNSNGTTYVLEWSVICKTNRVLALTNFSTHENFPYLKKPLTGDHIKRIKMDPKNIKIMNYMKLKAKEAEGKVERIEANTANSCHK